MLLLRRAVFKIQCSSNNKRPRKTRTDLVKENAYKLIINANKAIIEDFIKFLDKMDKKK